MKNTLRRNLKEALLADICGSECKEYVDKSPDDSKMCRWCVDQNCYTVKTIVDEVLTKFSKNLQELIRNPSKYSEANEEASIIVDDGYAYIDVNWILKMIGISVNPLNTCAICGQFNSSCNCGKDIKIE